MPYIGTSPSNGVRRVYSYTATASQTIFSGASTEGQTLAYTDSTYIDVYQNGVLLDKSDYTSTNGTQVVLDTAASADDVVVIIVYDVFSVADTVSKSDGGTFDGAVTMGGSLTATNLQATTIKESTGTNTAMTIDSSGRILTPQRPAFHARLSTGSGTGTQGDIVFNEEDFDIGSNYDTSNGRFTAPIAGIYYFAFDALVCESNGDQLTDGNYCAVRFHKNGSNGLFSQYSYNRTTGATQYNTINRIDCIQLSASDYIQVHVDNKYIYSDATGQYDATFQGFLIG
jgi:hypothetical protein